MILIFLIISKVHLILQTLEKRFKPLGFTVLTFDNPSEMIHRVNELKPDFVLVDGDGLEKEWKVLLTGLKMVKKEIIFILLISSMSIYQANEAVSLGVSGIILKPFQPDEHVRKILSIVNKNHQIIPKRDFLRFFLDPSEKAEIRYFETGSDNFHIFQIINISEKGAAFRITDPIVFDKIEPNLLVEEATITLENITASVSFRVVYKESNVVGVRFEEITKGKPEFLRHLESLNARVFEVTEGKGKW